jgi:hypothetical protein
VNVSKPDGKTSLFHSRWLETVNGHAESTISLLFNDTPGQWSVSVQDIVTGKKTEQVFLVTNREFSEVK